jgi:hypothetical protein
MADKKVSALSAITNLSQDDLFMVVDDPAGTPTSKKVTVGNLFGNVAVATTHKALTTFTANTNHTGTTATFSSNVVVGGVNIKSGVEDRMQVANTQTLHTSITANLNSYIANTNPRITTLEADVSSATASLALKSPISSPTFTGTATTPTLVISTKSSDPATSNATTESVTAGTIFYSNTYLYIATDSNTIKRVALGTF